jgi:hypothetical protein
MIHAEMLNNPSGYVAANHIIGLSLDKLPNGQAQACEVRKDEEGELRVPLGSMSTADFYTLAARLKVEILPSRFATAQELAAHRQQIRRNEERAALADELRAARKDGKGDA